MILDITKWVATVTLILGTFVNAGFPELYPIGPAILILGGFIWLGAAIKMRDPALVTTNLVMSMVGLSGLIFQILSN
jgi:hypothetical protein